MCACLVALCGCAGTGSATGTTVSAGAVVLASDIDRLTGEQWAGTLTYLDYSSQVQTTIKSSLRLARLPAASDGSLAWDMRVGYADEPDADSSETAMLSRGGRVFRDGLVLERSVLSDGTVRVVTEKDGQDDGRDARLRFVYLLGQTQCSIQNLVRLEQEEAFFERHIYRWSR
jgi:hypothetical protein